MLSAALIVIILAPFCDAGPQSCMTIHGQFSCKFGDEDAIPPQSVHMKLYDDDAWPNRMLLVCFII